MTSVPNVAERRRSRRACGIRARARIAMTTLAAAAALLLSAAPLAHASSGAGAAPARGSAAAATSNGQVTIAGTITWTQTGPPPLDYGPNAGQDVQTGTFHIDMASDTGLFGSWQDVGSSYQATDNFTESYQFLPGCTATTAGSVSVGGSFPPGALSLDAVPQSTQTWVGVHIWLNPAETYTTSAPCFATVTTQAAAVIQPQCFANPAIENSAGLVGLLTGSSSRGTIRINCSGSTPAYDGNITYSATGTLTVSGQRCAPPFVPSGPSWADKFPQSKKLSDLAGSFRVNVTHFIAAMTHAGIAVHVLSTYRPAERAYLMHYSWLIEKGKILPKNVPAFAPQPGESSVDICWVHYSASGAADLPASIEAATKLVKALGIDPKLKTAPALRSNHTLGLAIDMKTTWTAHTIVIVNGNGQSMTIHTTPHDGMNPRLWAVGVTFHVIHFHNASADPNHWSVNGH